MKKVITAHKITVIVETWLSSQQFVCSLLDSGSVWDEYRLSSIQSEFQSSLSILKLKSQDGCFEQ